MLVRTGSDKQLLIELFQIFKDNYPSYFVGLRKQVDKNNWVGVSEIAHRIKSSVAIMGMEKIKSEFEEIESLTTDGKPIDNFDSKIRKLESDINKAQNQISDFIDNI